MSALRSARAASCAMRAARASAPLRSFATTHVALKKPLTDDPTPVNKAPEFPAPVDPFHPSKTEPAPPKQYSEGTKKVVNSVARLMGYNTRTTTAIRETGHMMRVVVEAVERERSWWYGACALPPTYQTFFQLHLLYVLLLVTRLRALRASSGPDAPAPEPIEPGKPHNVDTSKGSAMVSPISISAFRPAHESYPTELLSHFFELSESEMRMVLGPSERERVIRKYMEEMGEQWKGAGAGLDYALGLGLSEFEGDYMRADAELASWVWRNLFASRGLAPWNTPEPVDELQFINQLELIVRFIRRELARLDSISDEDILAGNIGEWGKVEQ